MIHVPEMGTPDDMRRRQLLAHTDDNSRRNKVLHAREFIYERNYVVNTPQVENLLRDQSLVPTTVSSDPSSLAFIWCTNTVEECFFRQAFWFWLQFLLDACH